MKKSAVFFYLLLACCFLASQTAYVKDSYGGKDPLSELVKNLQKSGISQKELKGMNKSLENLLGKGGNKNDISGIISHLSKHGVSGDGLVKSVNAWNDLVNAGDSHKNSADMILKTLEHGKSKGLNGNNLANLIQQNLQQRKGGFVNGSSPELQAIMSELERNGVSQSDLNAARKEIKHILHKGANKDLTQEVLLDMTKRGVTGDQLTNSLGAWNQALNAGVSHQGIYDILSTTLKDSKAKGVNNTELAALIQAALKNRGR